jgi:hypothetical protein
MKLQIYYYLQITTKGEPMDAKHTIAKQINSHHTYIKAIQEYGQDIYGLSKQMQEGVQEYLHHVANDLGDSLDALLFDTNTCIEVWNKNQEHCGGYFGTPQLRFEVENYLLEPRWTDPRPGRFGATVAASRPALQGRTLDNKYHLALNLVQGKYTTAHTHGILLESEDGTVVQLYPMKSDGKVTVVNCLRRTEVSTAFDTWYTQEVQRDTGINFQDTPVSDEKNGAKVQYAATLPNGWTITQHTTYLDTPRTCNDCWNTQRFTLRRKLGQPVFDAQSMWQLESELETAGYHDPDTRVDGRYQEHFPPALTAHEEAILKREEARAAAQGFSLAPENYCWRLQYRKEKHEQHYPKWAKVQTITFKVSERDETVPPINNYLRRIAEIASK